MCDDRSSFFVAHQPPNRPVSSQTLSRWTKELLSLAGVDVSTFKSLQHLYSTANLLIMCKSASWQIGQPPVEFIRNSTRNICEDDVYPLFWYVLLVSNILFALDHALLFGRQLFTARVQFIVLSILTFQLSTLFSISWTLGLKTTVNMEIIQTTSDRIIFIYWVLKHNVQLCCCTLKSLLSQMSNLQLLHKGKMAYWQNQGGHIRCVGFHVHRCGYSIS